MVTSRQPRPDDRKGTSRSARPATGSSSRTAAASVRARPAPKPKDNKPLIIGAAAGGGLLLIVLIAVVASSGGPPPNDPGTNTSKAPPPTTPKKPPAPDVSGLESEGKTKCERGRANVIRIMPAFRSSKGPEREKLMHEVEAGLKDLKEGLAAYRQAAEKAGKIYKLEAYERAFEEGVDAYAKDLEIEASASCSEGLALIRSTEAEMTGKVEDPDKKKALAEKLEKAIALIKHGNNLRDLINQVSDRTYEDQEANKAYKAARMKLLELKD